uniref:Uncharacterized protein n=1 Tax=Cacopsylla melanoneura TaxID=428564 RepID=A0A8D8VTS2_9HEMI
MEVPFSGLSISKTISLLSHLGLLTSSLSLVALLPFISTSLTVFCSDSLSCSSLLPRFSWRDFSLDTSSRLSLSVLFLPDCPVWLSSLPVRFLCEAFSLTPSTNFSSESLQTFTEPSFDAPFKLSSSLTCSELPSSSVLAVGTKISSALSLLFTLGKPYSSSLFSISKSSVSFPVFVLPSISSSFC